MNNKNSPLLDWEKQQTPFEGEVSDQNIQFKALQLARRHYDEQKKKNNHNTAPLNKK